MKITDCALDKKTGLRKHIIDHAVRVPNGKGGTYTTHIKRVAYGANDLMAKIAEVKALAGGSLTNKTFGECIDYYGEHKGFKSKADVFERSSRDLGRFKIDNSFPSRYYDFIKKMSADRKVNTVNNYRICIRSALNFCVGKIIERNPIVDFGMEPIESRDRIWSEDEKNRIYNVMAQSDSHLYWSVFFAERNPIRGESDLWNLRTTDLDLFSDLAPCIRYFPRKTRKKKSDPTFLVELPNELIEQFKWQKNALPDCPYLFPRFWKPLKSETWKWEPMGSPIKHWRSICEKAQVRDFHFHDLRHVATTYMMEKRDETGRRIYDEDDLKSLGIFYSTRVVEIYRSRKAEKVVERVRRGYFVATKGGVASCGS